MSTRAPGDGGAPGPSPAPGIKVFLIGFSGTGKSHSGWLAARALGARFADMDHVIVREAGKPIVDIFDQDGEEAFRAMERRILAELASAPGMGVVSTGGGVPADSMNRDVMRSAGITIRLSAAPETIHRRLNRGGQGPASRGARSRQAIRPMLSEDITLERVRELLAEREATYSEAADVTIDTEGREPPDVAGEIVAVVRSWQRTAERPS